MKRKIIVSLLALFIFSASGTILAILSIKKTSDELSRLITLHQIEDMRKNLVISIQTVQSDLYTVNTPLAQRLDSIVRNVQHLEKTADECTGCHHSTDIAQMLDKNQSMVHSYRDALSYYITASANTKRIDRLQAEAAGIGNSLLVNTEEMSFKASKRLSDMTTDAMQKISRVKLILYFTMLLSLILGSVIAYRLTLSVTNPIKALVEATRAITSGDFGHFIDYRDKTEFGELAAHFNAMSSALKNGYAKLEKEIYERIETEDALKKSEAFLNTIFDSILDPFCIFDMDFRIIRANEAYARLKGRVLNDIIGKTCYEALAARGSVCEKCVVEKTFHTTHSCAKEKEMFLPDNTSIWTEVFTYPIFDGLNNITHVIEYARDITERKLGEAALRESRERYALSARGANDGLWDWDLISNSIYFSSRWKEMLGYGEDEIGNGPSDWLELIHPADVKEVEAKISAHMEGHTPHLESEYRILHKDGTFRWVLNRGLAVTDKSGKAYRMAGSQTDITERKLAEEQLIYDAFHDVLTGLPNRALFMNRLEHVIKSSKRRPGHHFAVLFLDIDRFKVINDSLGHIVGDKLLVEVSQRLVKCLRPGDTAARLGGDEFAILIEDIREKEDAVMITERIQQDIPLPYLIDEHEVFVTSSIGIALSSVDYELPEHLLRDADIAMYQAKAKGKACYEIFNENMYVTAVEHLQLETDLRRAVDHGEFLIHYQPIIDLKADKVIGFEALIRWQHPHRGLIYPLEFIPLAEETGLIHNIGGWILREACSQLRKLQSQFPSDPPLKLSVNISSKQLTQPDLVEKVAAALDETGIEPGSLALEITESMIMENFDTANEMMLKLRGMGIHIHIDDFGTGYSSLSYINRLPVNALKIDKSFVKKMMQHEDHLEIIRAIVALACNLNLEVIAEGVELSDQLTYFKNMDCKYVQGYLFSKPVEPAKLEKWMTARQKVLPS